MKKKVRDELLILIFRNLAHIVGSTKYSDEIKEKVRQNLNVKNSKMFNKLGI